MKEGKENQGSLRSRYRALGLTIEKGMMGGKILADLGIEVNKVEPPGEIRPVIFK